MKIELLNKDCMDVMAEYPDKYFDLAIIDPPYGIGQDGRNNHSRGKMAKSKDYSQRLKYDNNAPEMEFFVELIRISKNQVIFGANHFISKIPYDSSCWIVWDKDNGETDFADCELAWTSFKTAVRKFRYKWQGMLQENMKNKEVLIHPNHKPIMLYKWILKNYAKPEFKIIDTHLGSGSSAIAAYDFGVYEFIGCEIDKEYFEAAKQRFDIYKMQQKLF
jgi:site-specific DNA-methyltransferase (adenine-specific)